GAILSAGSFSRARLRDRPVAVLDTQCLCRLVADLRSAIPGLLAAAFAACVPVVRARVHRDGCNLFRDAVSWRRRNLAVLPRPQLASGGWVGGGARLCLWRFLRGAAAAYRADHEHLVSRPCAMGAGARTGSKNAWIRIYRGTPDRSACDWAR